MTSNDSTAAREALTEGRTKTRAISSGDAAAAWKRIEPRLDTSGECWLWTGRTNHDGYAEVWCGSAYRRVHRVAFAHFRGDTPMELDHLCRNRACANPSHLEPVTSQENNARGTGPSSWALRDGACKAGHPYTEGSFYLWRGARKCRECRRVQDRVGYARDPEKRLARFRSARAKDPEKDRKRCREYYARKAAEVRHAS